MTRVKVIVKNSNPIPAPECKRVYKCNVCGRESFWSDTHTYVERPNEFWEEQFIACSDECRNNSRELFIKWLSTFKGWSIKKAAENYDIYVLKNRK